LSAGAELLVVVEPGHQPLVQQRLVRVCTVNDTLVEIRGSKPVHPGGEVDVRRVGDLRRVVPAVRQLRERQRVLTAVVLDLDVALFDVDIRQPYSPMVPSLTKWQSMLFSSIENTTLRLFSMLFICVKTACRRSTMEYGAEGTCP
jgi:hypothetical protein